MNLPAWFLSAFLVPSPVPQSAEKLAVVQKTPKAIAHESSTFRFRVQAPMAKVAPLFGAEGERCWAGHDWNPEFFFPQPAHDIQGAVFTVQHDGHHSVWINTVFDLASGRMQYVSFIPEAMVTVVDVRLFPQQGATAVEVTYSRTALDPAANPHVLAMSQTDWGSGPHWQAAIESCLGITAH